MNAFITEDISEEEYIRIVKQFKLSSSCIKFSNNKSKRYTIWANIKISNFHIEIHTRTDILPAINLSSYKEMKWNSAESRYE